MRDSCIQNMLCSESESDLDFVQFTDEKVFTVIMPKESSE